MENATQLANRFREVLLNGKWIANTNFQDQLTGVTLAQATKKVGAHNSIATLTFHVNYYIEGLVHFFESGKLEISDKYSFDYAVPQSEEDWQKMIKTLVSNAQKFANHVEAMSEAQLNAVFVDEKYGDYRRNIEGMIEHSYYHLGQISLLKKLV
jgi:uncharacterized damage-inducible protein DinB